MFKHPTAIIQMEQHVLEIDGGRTATRFSH